MVGAGGRRVFLLVAGIAIRGRSLENVIHMTLCARHRGVCSGQRKGRRPMIEGGGNPRCRRMTEGTVGGIARLHVIRIRGCIKVLLVA